MYQSVKQLCPTSPTQAKEMLKKNQDQTKIQENSWIENFIQIPSKILCYLGPFSSSYQPSSSFNVTNQPKGVEMWPPWLREKRA